MRPIPISEFSKFNSVKLLIFSIKNSEKNENSSGNTTFWSKATADIWYYNCYAHETQRIFPKNMKVFGKILNSSKYTGL